MKYTALGSPVTTTSGSSIDPEQTTPSTSDATSSPTRNSNRPAGAVSEDRVERVRRPPREELVLVRGRPERAGAPERELPHDGLQLAAVVGELVDARGRGRRQPPLRDDAGGLEVAEPGRQDVRPDARQALRQVGVALRPVHQLLDDEHRPPLPDEAEGVRDGAVVLVFLGHGLHCSAAACCCEDFTCETQVDSVRLQVITEQAKGRSEMVSSDRRKWLALALLSAVQFMVVLDIAIVNVALPSIQVDLGFSQENLQWVISA